MKNIFWKTLSFLMFATVLCACNDNPDEEIDSVEKQFVGTWTQIEPTSAETLNYTFSSKKVGSFFVTNRDGNTISSQTFYWSADETYLTLKNVGQQRRVEYTIKENVLMLGTGNDAVAYARK